MTLIPLRIAFASGKPLFPIGEGGGETIAHDLLSGLTQVGHQVTAVGQAAYTDLPRLNSALSLLGCELSVEQMHNRITSFNGRDIVYPTDARFAYQLNYATTLTTQGTFLTQVDQELTRHNCTILLFQAERSPELLKGARSRGVYPLFYAQNGLELSHFERPLELPLVLTNSAFFRDRLQAERGVRAEVLYPAVDLERYRIKRKTADYITMINPIAVKGVAPFLKLAAALPSRRFLAVEGWGTPPAIVDLIRTKLPNVTYLEKQLDMRKIYEQTHILVVPSQWEESFGRVITEAQVSGIPVLASKIGGIPEALGDGGLLVNEISNPDAWRKGLLEVESRYDELSVNAVRNAERFSVAASVASFEEIVKTIPGLMG